MTTLVIAFACFLLGYLLGIGRRPTPVRYVAVDPLAEYETVDAPEHAPSRN